MQGAGNKMEAAKYRDKLDDYWAKREKEEVSIQDFFFRSEVMFDVGFQSRRFHCKVDSTSLDFIDHRIWPFLAAADSRNCSFERK